MSRPHPSLDIIRYNNHSIIRTSLAATMTTTTTTIDNPGGLWDRLTPQPATRQGQLYSQITERTTAPQQPGLWATLAERTDPTQYRPQALPDVAGEQVHEGEQELTVIRSPHGNYLRLTPEQRTIWHQMDGTRTVGQLATDAFLQFHQLLPVGDLVAALHREGFLHDQPVGIYRAVATHGEARTAEGWGKKVLRFLTGQRAEVKNIDGIYGAVYRTGGQLLFTPVFAVIWFVVALIGAAAFVLLLLGGTARATGGGTLPWQIATLWLALLTSFLLHESAHALAVKRFGRNLRGGGVMLYFGAPAFYVDTSDIWRSPRRARVLVSAAGPMSDLFVGGLAAMFALLQPDALLAPVAAKLAFTCYIATLFNANPLLELDGYYILVDLLRLPDLRRRALAFVRGPLWDKTRRKTNDERRKTKEQNVRRSSFVFRPLSREERIFTLYGLLAILYTLIAIVFAVQFWQRWVWGTVVGLWTSNDLGSQSAAALIVLLVVAPVVVGLGIAAWGTVRGAVEWLIRRGYGRRPDLVAGVCAAAAGAFALGFGGGSGPLVGQLLPLVLWGVAAAALFALRPDYRNATIAPAITMLVAATVLAGVASLLRIALPASWWWQAADGVALLFLLIAAFTAQLDVNLRQTPPRIQLTTALMLIASFVIGGWVLAEQLGRTLPFSPTTLLAATPRAVLVSAPAFFGTLALALLLPYLYSLSDSRLVWSWGLLWAAALAQTMAYVVDLRGPSLGLDILSAGLWAAAGITHLATLRQITPAELPWQHSPSLSERERLARAFQLTYAGCYQLLLAVYGYRRTQELDDRMDVLAATTNWDVRLDRDQAEIGPRLAAQSLDIQGARFAEVLRYTVATIEQIAGESFARRTIQAAYDALPWPERETAGRLCFPDTPWARTLSSAFGDAQHARMRLLREVDLLLGCSDGELSALARDAQTVQLRAGERLLRAGEPVPGVWIIEAGEVLAKQGDSVLRELHRGQTFGAKELAAATPALLNYRASVNSTLLFISAAELQPMLTPRSPAEVGSVATLRLLERVPLFAQLPRTTLRALAQASVAKSYAPREAIIRQGVPSGTFFVITSGHAAVLTRAPDQADGSRQLRVVARLGPEEFFGELELLDGTPPRAHVIAESALTALAIPHATVRTLVLGDSTASSGLHQVSSGRMLALR